MSIKKLGLIFILLLNISFLPSPATISKQNAYLSGLIDADGSFTISVSKSTFQNSQTAGLQGRIDRLANARGFSQISAKWVASMSAGIRFRSNR